jgi:hypothetical protein
MGAHKMTGRFFHVPEALAIIPKEGRCLVGRYWIVHPEKGLYYYYLPMLSGHNDTPCMQANKSWAVTKYIMDNAQTKQWYEGHYIKQIECVYEAHAIEIMRLDKIDYINQQHKEKGQRVARTKK